MNREQKAKLVQSMRENIFTSEVFVIFKNKGLTVKEFNSLRSNVKEAGGSCLVSKNRLAKIAIANDESKSRTEISEFFSGPTAIVSSGDSNDVIAVIKSLVDFCKKAGDKTEIVIGSMAGEVLNRPEIEKLASLPSLDVLRSTLLRTMQAPATNLVRVCLATQKGLLQVVEEGRKKKEASGS